MRTIAVWMTVVGCNGKGDDTDTAGDPDLCGDLATAPLPTVAATEWPTGLTEVMPNYREISGRYSTTSSCGAVLTVKVTAEPESGLEVVTTPYPAGAGGCGCTTDPSYGDDAALGAIALVDTFEFYVEEYADPALDGESFDLTGALFPPTADVQFRGCAEVDVDPVLVSAYDRVSIAVRMTGGSLNGSVTLTPAEGDPEVCDLGGFNKISD
ncbi:MAG: hypothetical protein ABMA64_29575 [Myxococcota bacterium]